MATGNSQDVKKPAPQRYSVYHTILHQQIVGCVGEVAVTVSAKSINVRVSVSVKGYWCRYILHRIRRRPASSFSFVLP